MESKEEERDGGWDTVPSSGNSEFFDLRGEAFGSGGIILHLIT